MAKKRSLILAGGGLKVAFQAGVMQVWLEEAGLTFDHVDGASGGVFNLAMLCQGMKGGEIADNWRKMNPIEGVSFNLPRLDRLQQFAQSMFTLDAYRARVFPEWGLNWPKIQASALDATFNVYNFSKHQLEVLPPAQISEDMLCACVSLPMWFPPVVANGQTYIDAVYITDANLDEAIRRGAEEIWVIWTVGRRAIWRDGFVNNYFQIIETAANGHFNRICKRIEDNNAAIAGGKPGEFGRKIDLKVLAAEVPLHYLINLNADQFGESVNMGVLKAREWCQQQGIPFTPRQTPPAERPAGPKVKLQFTEQMKGFIALGESDYQRGFAKGKQAGTAAMVHLTIKIDDVDRFVTDPKHEAKAEGYFKCDAFGGKREVSNGVFNLFVDAGDPDTKAMYYRLFITDKHGKPRTVLGFKTIKDDPGADEWDDTTTLFTRVLDGHVGADDDGAATTLASGIIRIQMLDFLQQLTTFRVEGGNAGDRFNALSRFGGLFIGKLWEVYGPQVLRLGAA
jgi:predicted acylesterase/phospholipase RssA